jgi:hypothetical protein
MAALYLFLGVLNIFSLHANMLQDKFGWACLNAVACILCFSGFLNSL